MDWQTDIKCNFCNNKENIPVLSLDLKYLKEILPEDVEEGFKVVKCKDCGLLYSIPRPDESKIPNLYQEEFFRKMDCSEWNVTGKTNPLNEFIESLGIKKKCKSILKYKKTGSILDIGCATGMFLLKMQDYGWKVQGVEVGSFAVKLARKRGIDVFEGTLHNARYEDQTFDVVTMWNVLDHLSNPKETLLEINRILRDNGFLIINVANVDSFEQRLFKKYWIGWGVPWHLHYFSPHSIKNMLSYANFTVKEMKYMMGGYVSLVKSIEILLNEKISNKKMLELLQRFFKSIIFRLIITPYLLIIGRFNKGGTFTIFAQKSN